MRKYLAEFIGTFWLVFGGCGSAIFAAAIPESNLGIGYIGVSLAFGLTVLSMAYAVGHISGGHFNPAVTLGLLSGGRFDGRDVLPYIGAQVAGAIAAAFLLFTIKSGQAGGEIGGFAANGYGSLSPHGYSMIAGFVAEFILTAFFLIVILGATDKWANGKFAGIAIGLALTLIHLISIPITNTSVNPARSTSQAIFVGGEYLAQLWLFWVAPVAGAIVGGVLYRSLLQKDAQQ